MMEAAITDQEFALFQRLIYKIAGISLNDTKKVLLVAGAFDQPTFLSGRNVPKAILVGAPVVNAEHLLNCDKVIIVADALPILSQRTA